MATQTNSMFHPTPVNTKSKDGCWKTTMQTKQGKRIVSVENKGSLNSGYNCGVVKAANAKLPPPQGNAQQPQGNAQQPQGNAKQSSIFEQVQNVNTLNSSWLQGYDILRTYNLVTNHQAIKSNEITMYMDGTYNKQNLISKILASSTNQKVYEFKNHIVTSVNALNVHAKQISELEFEQSLTRQLQAEKTEGFTFAFVLQPHNNVNTRMLLFLNGRDNSTGAGAKFTKTQESTTFTITINNKKRTYTRIVHKGAHGAKFVKFNGTFQRLSTLRRQ